ncbi:MAG TPA: serine/threonine-protein kinase, partial [Pirellulales bacterium]|nr:serine/threonine-protein kinase [Pirellulales bacterium]
MTKPDAEHDDQFVDLLVAYDTQLAAGSTSLAGLQEPLSSASPEVLHQLEEAKNCLLRLERIWPRTKPLEVEMPASVGRFQVLSELGRGGFGIVYLAKDPSLGRTIALKVQRPEAILSPTMRGRFIREAKAAGRLRHPNIAAVYDANQEGLQFWIASEYCDGKSLGEWLHLKRAQVAPRTAAAFMVALADALEYSHQQGVLHRDLKPNNVLLHRVPMGGNTNSPDDLRAFTPKLIDFGLAKLRESESQETRSGALLGTPAYMAPEQAGGRLGEIGPTTDVYGLGTILYELLTGIPVFRGANDADTLRRIVADEPANLRTLRPDLPRDLEAICLKCLQKRQANRYATAAALASDLRRFLQGQATAARPLTMPRLLLKFARRRPELAGLLAVSLVASLSIIALTAVYVARLRSAQQAAELSRSEAELSAKSAETQEQFASRYMYVSNMRHAYEWLEQGQVQKVEQLLEPYESDARLAALRGFEWFHLKRRVHGEKLTLSGHKGEVYGVTFSPDGRLLVSGGQDGSIKFWDPRSGQELASLSAHSSCVNMVAYSPDGQVLASGSCDHSIKLWQATTHELLSTLKDDAGEVHCLAFSPDGRLLASGGNHPITFVWDLASQGAVARIVNTQRTNGLVWQPDGRKLVVATDRVLVCDFDNDRWSHWDAPAQAAAFSPVASDLTVATPRGEILVFSEGNSNFVERLTGPARAAADSLAFSSNGEWLASGSTDSNIRIWGRDRL